MSRATDPVRAAADTLRRHAAAVGCEVAVVAGDAVDWWSATFAGHRVTLTIEAAPGDALDAWLAALPDAELPLAGRFVADCTVEASAPNVAVVSLLVLDAD